jgi:hypothetical protein
MDVGGKILEDCPRMSSSALNKPAAAGFPQQNLAH